MILQPVKLWRRLAAMFYDALIAVGLLIFTSMLVVLVNRGHGIAAGQWWFRSLLLAVLFSYFAFCWLRGGQTVGMRTWRIYLVTRNQQPLTLWHATLRFAYACPAILCAGLGLWWSLLDKDSLAWHDRWSGTALKYAPATTLPKQCKAAPATTLLTSAANE